MVQLLKSAIGKHYRFLIVNGALFKLDDVYVKARVHHFKIEFVAYNPRTNVDVQELDYEVCIEAIQKRIKSFDEKYSSLVVDAGSNYNDNIRATTDPFTNAVCIYSKTFELVSDPMLHNGVRQYTTAQETLLRDFVINYVFDYMVIYTYLINKRLLSQYTPAVIKGHLVSGLCQPLMIRSSCIESPLTYGEFKWARDMFAQHEIWLERESWFARKRDLTCVPMCDIAKVLSTDVVLELDRRRFLFMLFATILHETDDNKATEFITLYKSLYTSIIEDSGQKALLSAMLTYAHKIRTTIAIGG